jgi:hypothetical protein
MVAAFLFAWVRFAGFFLLHSTTAVERSVASGASTELLKLVFLKQPAQQDGCTV